MVYSIVAVVIAIVCTYFSYAYLTFRKKETKSVPTFFAVKFHKKVFLTSIVSLIGALVIYFLSRYSYDKSVIMSYLNLIAFIWIVAMGYIDAEEKIIPHALIGVGLAMWVIFVLAECMIAGLPLKYMLIYSLLGGGLCGGVLLIIATIGKSALGMGDVKMFTAIGLLYGLSNTYTIILMSIIIMAVVSVILLALKKVTRKTAVPMAPFVAIGFFICMLMGL